MASDEARKKWGTIFMGEREASVEQLDAMQEPLRREKIRQEQTEDYMERVRKRAADRAREILGAAYAERLKVLDEARAEADAARRAAARDAQKLKGEGEALKKEAAEELEKARKIREEAEQMRASAREDGIKEGMEQADGELREFRGELGRSLARVLTALGGERKKLIESWREELCDLACAASAAGAGYLLQKEHKAILSNLVMQALRQLENRSTITVRVNPEDEAAVVDMFQAARECVPDIRQWIVTPDENIEAGGFVAESGAGRVDCRRQNFREMVDNILAHLTLPILESEEESARAMRDIVDEEAARLADILPPDAFAAPLADEMPANDGAGDAALPEQEPDDANPQGMQGAEAAEGPVSFDAPEEMGQPTDADADDLSALNEDILNAGAAAEALAGYVPPNIAPDEDELAEELADPIDLDEPLPEIPQEDNLEEPEEDDGQPTLAELEDELFAPDEREKN